MAAATADSKPEVSIAKDLLAGAGAFKSAVTDVAQGLNELKQLVHTESTSHIQERVQQRGLDSLSVQCVPNNAIIERTNLKEWIDLTLDDWLQAANSVTVAKKFIENLKRKINLVVFAELLGTLQLSFQNMSGSLALFALSIKPIRGDKSLVHVSSMAMVAKFTLARDYFIVRVSEKDFFSSSSWDEIRYVNRGITEQDIQCVMCAAMAPIASFMQAQHDAIENFEQQCAIDN